MHQHNYSNTDKKSKESKLSRGNSPSKMDYSIGASLLKDSSQRTHEPNIRKQTTNASKYSNISGGAELSKDIKPDEQLDEDEREHRITSYSYDFNESNNGEASLKKLLSMSNTLGYSPVQMRELREKQKELEAAERMLIRQQKLKKQQHNDAYLQTRNTKGSGTFIVHEKHRPSKLPPGLNIGDSYKYKSQKSATKTSNTSVVRSMKHGDRLSMIQEISGG